MKVINAVSKSLCFEELQFHRFHYVKFQGSLWVFKFNNCDAPRGGARQRGDPNLENQNPPKILPSSRKTLAKSSQNPPKTLPKPIQNEVCEAPMRPKKRPRSAPEHPRNAKQAPKSTPMAPKRPPKLSKNLNGALEGPRPHFYMIFWCFRCREIWIDFSCFFHWIFIAQTLEFIDFLEGKRYFFENA